MFRPTGMTFSLIIVCNHFMLGFCTMFSAKSVPSTFTISISFSFCGSCISQLSEKSIHVLLHLNSHILCCMLLLSWHLMVLDFILHFLCVMSQKTMCFVFQKSRETAVKITQTCFSKNTTVSLFYYKSKLYSSKQCCSINFIL